jgi:FkbM family methyltransferase
MEINRPRLILDLGANNGDDIPYYLQKADLVVAVEANPALCEEMRARFATEIEAKSLVVENVVVTVDGPSDTPQTTTFYINKQSHHWSQIHKPIKKMDEFESRILPAIDVVQLVQKYTPSHEMLYFKIDLENFDSAVVKHLLRQGIRPIFLSAEVHSLKVFMSMVLIGKYNAFKIVRGDEVSNEYSNLTAQGISGPFQYSFPRHSAGPFGDDLKGQWLTRVELLDALKHMGLGWRDIHATHSLDARYSHESLGSFLKFGAEYFLAWMRLVPRAKFWKFRRKVAAMIRNAPNNSNR